MSAEQPGAVLAEAVASLADVPVGTMKGVVLSSGTKLCLVHTAAGLFAIADRCSHRDFPLSVGELTADGMVECAWHGAQFDPATGVMVIGPGGDDVPTYDVHLDGDTIRISLTGR